MDSRFVTTLDEIVQDAFMEFSSVLDYIWKSPSLIDYLVPIELRKLQTYGLTPEEREFRRLMEFKKLLRIFPNLIAQGNIYIACSLFEADLLKLCKMIQELHKKQSCASAGQGLNRWLAYLRAVGVPTNDVKLWPQVDAAFKVRNCLMHAAGSLEESRDTLEIRRIIKSRVYLTLQHRSRTKAGESRSKISIVSGDVGDSLEITNEYAFLACAYMRDYFCTLCLKTKEVLLRQDGTSV